MARLIAALLASFALVVTTAGAVAAEETATASAAGVITGPDGTPWSGDAGFVLTLQIERVQEDVLYWDDVDTDFVDAGTSFSFTGLEAGRYRLLVSPFDSDFVAAYSAPFTLADGQSLTGLQVSLPAAAAISGVVSGAGGAPLPDSAAVYVVVDRLVVVEGDPSWDLLAGWDEATSGDDPRFGFRLGSLSAGTYRVRAFPVGDENDDTVSRAFELSTGQQMTGFDIELGSSPVPPDGQTPLQNVARPTVAGTAVVGHTLTVAAGGWDVRTPTLQYRWWRDSTAIAGASSRTYRLVPADRGHRVKAVVSASRIGRVSTSVSSNSTAVVKQSVAMRTSGSGGKGKATLHIRVAATSVPASSMTGTVRVYLKGKRLKTVQLRNGAAKVTVTKQKKGKRTYRIAYAGTGTLLPANGSVRVRIR